MTSPEPRGTAVKWEPYRKDGMFKEVRCSARSLLPTPGGEAFIPGSHKVCGYFRQLSLFTAGQDR